MNVELLLSKFSALEQQADVLVEGFYKKSFKQYTSAIPLKPNTDLKAQPQKN